MRRLCTCARRQDGARRAMVAAAASIFVPCHAWAAVILVRMQNAFACLCSSSRKPGQKGDARYKLRGVQRQHFFDRRPLADALHVRSYFGKLLDVHAIAFEPARQGKQVAVSDTVAVTHHPRPGQ